jgi:hypothetical protein
MAILLWQLFNMFNLIQKIWVYVKDKGSNLQTCEYAVNSIISCDTLGMFEPFDGTCIIQALLIHYYK